MKNDLQTTSWDNTNVYKDLKDPKIKQDLDIVEKTAETILKNASTFNHNDSGELFKNLELITDLYKKWLDANILVYTLYTYSMTKLSVNSLDYEAKDIQDKVKNADVNLSKAFKPIQICMLRAPEEFVTEFLKDERVKEVTFLLKRERERNEYLLPLESEVLITGFAQDGLSAWGKLYSEISGSIKVNIDGKEMGLAQTNGLITSEDRAVREKAYRAVNEAWRKHEISACAILNSINGWRTENHKVRSTKKSLHYLDEACHMAYISRKTLDTLMGTVYEKRSVGQEAFSIVAKESNVEKLGPWDWLAPKPNQVSSAEISFPEAIDMIVEAFNEVHPEMGAFAKMMKDKNWIDCSYSENRASGAYCTGFVVNNEPRIFMTYQGNMKNVITLAHEIGHGYHSWVMRDLKLSESDYPMTLAETASIFAEATIRDFLIKKSKSNEELKAILWQELQAAQGFMINIPARFEFEKRFAELRKNKSVTVPETKEMMIESQKHWYGNTMSEYDEMFWANKMHFSMADRSFYNYPYLFGYLFSLGIYAKKDSLGKDFHSRYVALLRDTGRMTAEDLVMKHFNEDITKSDFWLKSIAIVEGVVKQYKSLM